MQGAFGVDVRNRDGLIVISDMSTGLWLFQLDGFTAGTATTTACRTSRACRTTITAQTGAPISLAPAFRALCVGDLEHAIARRGPRVRGAAPHSPRPRGAGRVAAGGRAVRSRYLLFNTATAPKRIGDGPIGLLPHRRSAWR